MNKLIDIDKMYEMLKDSNMEHLAKRIADSAVVDCNECKYKLKAATNYCIKSNCVHNPSNKPLDYFDLKECEHVWLYYSSGRIDVKRKCESCALIQWGKFDED